MATVRLNVLRRENLGKQGAKRTRAAGRIPGVLYGEKKENLPLSVDAHDLRVALSTPSGRNVIIQVLMDGAESARAVVRDMERDPISRDILHVDLQRIAENKPVTMNIPVIVSGVSPAVKEGRGILDHTMRQLEVKCLPKDIPEHIEVDVSELDVNGAIHVSDISVPDVELLDNPERPVVEILRPTIFEEPTEPVEEVEAVEGEEGEEAPEGGAEEGQEGEEASETSDEKTS